MVAITNFNRDDIIEAVQHMYTGVATQPALGYHFPTGRQACEFLGYPADDLDRLPTESLESFAGVAYPFVCNVIKPGDRVLDIGAGAGTDIAIAMHHAGKTGQGYALDITQAMHEKLKLIVRQHDLGNIEPLLGNAENIPLKDHSVDVVTSNGVLNLVPDKQAAIREIFRVLKPGGYLQLSDIVIRSNNELLAEVQDNPRLWAECIVGALYEDDYLQALTEAGFDHIERVARSNYFAHSPNQRTREIAGFFDAEGIVIRAQKPETAA